VALAGIEARTFNGDVAEDRAVPNLPPSFATQLSITACTACAFDAKRLALRGNNFLLDAQKNNFAFLYGQADITGGVKALGECANLVRVRGAVWRSDNGSFNGRASRPAFRRSTR